MLWGSVFLAIRVGVETMPPFLMGGIRFLASGAVMLLLSLIEHEKRRISLIDALYAIVVGVFLWFGANGLLMIGEQTVPSGLTALIWALIPIWIAVIEVASGSRERLDFMGGLGIVLGFAGVATLVLPNLLTQSLSVAFGELLVVGATLCWSMGTLISRRHNYQTPLFLLTSVQCFAGGVPMTLVSIYLNEWRGEVIASVAPIAWWALGYLIVFGTSIAFTAYMYLLRNVPASRVVTYTYVLPVIALVFGGVILGETLTIWIFAGTIIILAGLTLVHHIHLGIGKQRH